MRRLALIWLVLASLGAQVRAQSPEAVGEAGQLQYGISTFYVTHISGTNTAWVQAMAGLKIRNTGSNPVKLALLPGLTLQVESGYEFNFPNAGWVSGLPFCNGDGNYCNGNSGDFPVLSGGRTLIGNLKLQMLLGNQAFPADTRGNLSGRLFVRDLGTGRHWVEPFTVADVPVHSRLHN